MIQTHHRNSHTIKVEGRYFKLYMLSDLHWDNPHCDRVALAKHLTLAKEEGAKVAINGDFFCLMQGKYDPRRSKKDILPEHNKVNYLDAVIEDAVNWFGDWADTIIFIAYGNHETAIIKNVETDPLQRFADLFNYTYKPTIPITVGGYGGWLTLQFTRQTTKKSYAIHYYHGSGGGGAVTKGTIQHQRKMADIEGADCVWMGHVHELYAMYQTKAGLDGHRLPILKEVLHLRTGTYKDEYGDGAFGWHVERGAPPKPIGCITLDFYYRRTHTTMVLDVTPKILSENKFRK